MIRQTKSGERLPPFVPVLLDTWKAPAWRAMSAGARLLYIALKARYSVKKHNNGWLFLSVRDAANELGSSAEQIVRWFRELQHFGFIVKMTDGKRGERGLCPHWRLTELGYQKEPPSRDFLRWNGAPFRSRPVSPGQGLAASVAACGFESHRANQSAGDEA